jgi:3',5'-cyclic AMP phosphodiesterase CpdA
MLHAVVALVLCLPTLGMHTPARHPGPEPLGTWAFIPSYELPLQAANRIGPRPVPPEAIHPPVAYEPEPLRFFGMPATDRYPVLLPNEALPSGSFSVELWVVDHVNQPVGMLAAARGRGPLDDTAWAIGYTEDRVFFGAGEGLASRIETPVKPLAFKKYWYHLIAVYDQAEQEIRLYVNGTMFGGVPFESAALLYGEDSHFEIAGYLSNEPFMRLGNLLHRAAVYGEALDDQHVAQQFSAFCSAIEEGLIAPGQFHFTAGPALNATATNSVSIVWEADRPASAVVEYGRSIPLEHRIEVPADGRIVKARLDGLEASTPYLYRITSTDAEGRSIESGLLTFKTAVTEDQAFSFAVIGDTESRPHINDRIAKLIWDQRPDFVINCGDLTDGGEEPHKFEWNLEYFLGMSQLASRIPIFPVPGNGESDLYWYDRFHDLPGEPGVYSFRFGNAEFFMLDSNRAEEEFREGGRQYEWLREKLAASDATWKFAAHHHPVYTSDEDDYGNTWRGEQSPLGDINVRRVMSLYEEFGVDAVFFGHLHTYERSWPVRGGQVNASEGVVYIQSGGAGGHLENFAPTRSWFKRQTMRGHHYCMLDIAGGTLEFRMYSTDGSLRDLMTLSK